MVRSLNQLSLDAHKEAQTLATLLKQKQLKLVLSESCTAGLISSTLSSVPGISENFCGSAVVYRNDTKNKWLDISSRVINQEGPVSRAVAHSMATSVLKMTPEADISASITGFLGPSGPKNDLGKIVIGVALRGSEQVWLQEKFVMRRERPTLDLRKKRQWLASLEVLFMVRSLLLLEHLSNQNG